MQIFLRTAAKSAKDYTWYAAESNPYGMQCPRHIHEVLQQLDSGGRYMLGAYGFSGAYTVLVGGLSSGQSDPYGRTIRVTLAIDDLKESQARALALAYLNHKQDLEHKVAASLDFDAAMDEQQPGWMFDEDSCKQALESMIAKVSQNANFCREPLEQMKSVYKTSNQNNSQHPGNLPETGELPQLIEDLHGKSFSNTQGICLLACDIPFYKSETASSGKKSDISELKVQLQHFDKFDANVALELIMIILKKVKPSGDLAYLLENLKQKVKTLLIK